MNIYNLFIIKLTYIANFFYLLKVKKKSQFLKLEQNQLDFWVFWNDFQDHAIFAQEGLYILSLILI